MTTVSQIITDAYQFNNIVALSVIPTAAEQNKALRYLNRIFQGVFGDELGDPLVTCNIGKNGITEDGRRYIDDYYIDAPYYVPHNSRVALNLDTNITVYLPTVPNDGERIGLQDLGGNLSTNNVTVEGNGRLIENVRSIVLNTDNTNTEWFFRADLGNWVKITDLLLTDDFPLPIEFEEFFITALAIRLGSSEDVGNSDGLSYVFKTISKKFRARYKQIVQMPSELGLLRTINRSQMGYRFNNG